MTAAKRSNMADLPEVPLLVLERHLLGELSPTEQARLEGRLAAESPLRARLAALAEESGHILRTYPPATLVPAIELRGYQESARRARHDSTRRVRHERGWGWQLWAPAGGALAAAALAVALLQPGATTPPDTAELEVTREKGQHTQLLVFPRPAPGAEPRALDDGSEVASHELLQLGYVASGKRHGVIVSIDGRGEATLHFPATPELSTRLSPGQTLLPSAYELDDAPRFERFFLVTSPRAISVAAVLAAARRLAGDEAHASSAPLGLPPDLEQTSLLLLKYNGNHKEMTAP